MGDLRVKSESLFKSLIRKPIQDERGEECIVRLKVMRNGHWVIENSIVSIQCLVLEVSIKALIVIKRFKNVDDACWNLQSWYCT